MNKLAVALCLLASACFPFVPEQRTGVHPWVLPLRVFIADGSLKSCHRQALVKAEAAWNEAACALPSATGGCPRMVQIIDAVPAIGDLRPGTAFVVALDDLGGLRNGEASWVHAPNGQSLGGIIRMESHCEWVDRTAAHEVGHLLGVGHSEDPESVMFRYVNVPSRGLVTAEDISEALPLH